MTNEALAGESETREGLSGRINDLGGYTHLFNAIASAVSLYGGGTGINVSPLKFVEALGAAALSPDGTNASETGDAVERVSAVDAFEMGCAWANQLQGQTLEDSRAVGRTLGSDTFAAIAPQIEAAEKELGFDPFTSADYGICAARKIINAAIAATPAGETVRLLRDKAVALALEAGKLNVALDGQEKYRRQRQAVTDAMMGLHEALAHIDATLNGRP
jgi:hypothetical protein